MADEEQTLAEADPDAPKLTAEGAPRAAHYEYVEELSKRMPHFDPGDHVELIECDQWPNMIGRRGIVDSVPDDPIAPGCLVLWDPPDKYFPGLSTLRSHFRKIDDEQLTEQPPSA